MKTADVTTLRSVREEHQVDSGRIRKDSEKTEWWSAVVMEAAVAASIQASVLFGTDAVKPKKRKRIKLSELQSMKR